MSDAFKATYADGQSAQKHEVIVTLNSDGLLISGDSLNAPVLWDYNDLRHVEDIANQRGASFQNKDIPGRLNVPDTFIAQKLQKLAPNLDKKEIATPHIRRVALWGAAAILSVVLILFVIIPSLANQLATMIPVEREIALGNQSVKQIEKFLTIGDDQPLTCTGSKGQMALEKMTARLAAHIDSPYPLERESF